MLSKKDDLPGFFVNPEKLLEALITVTEENLIVLMIVRGEERDDA